MLKALGSRLTYANVMATMAVFLALGGGAYALSGIPDRAGVYHGCVDPKAGALRVVKGVSACRKAKSVRRGGRRVRIPGESAIAWNQTGPRGLQGVQGIQGGQGVPGVKGGQGLQGLRGDPGQNGATNVVVRIGSMFTNSTGELGGTANCNPGERAISGGAGEASGQGIGDKMGTSVPITATHDPAQTGDTPTGWTASFTTATATTIIVYVVCASP